ncbi:MAG: PhoH family protein [Nitrococcus mobilis]|nr:PhoH family protein [Nitrococcus mobilis]
MPTKSRAGRRVFVLDTSVLMHDPSALFRFQEHDLFLPMAVLRALDTGKKGLSEEARNVRQVSRFLDQLLGQASPKAIESGLALAQTTLHGPAAGRLYFLRQSEPHSPPKDDDILTAALQLQESRPDVAVTLVSKDITLRIQAMALGLNAEDYHSDQVLDDVDLLYTGTLLVKTDRIVAQTERALEFLIKPHECYPNLCVTTEDGRFEGIVREIHTQHALASAVTNHRGQGEAVWGVQARNPEQNFALNLLLDPEVDFLSLLGVAGTGKTLLALAAGLAQTLEMHHYREIVMTRATVPIGEDIGFLPGTEEEKMTPWMGALLDNLEVLGQPEGATRWGQAATQDVLRSRIKIRSLNFMRGRTFLNRYIIVDEAQNLTAKQLKTLITRAGPGTKIVCLGNVAQIDTPYLTATTSGLTYVVDRFRYWPYAGHVTLQRGERSRLADFASEAL